MKASAAVRECIRSVLRRPPLIALEIAWRWTLGLSCSLLLWAIFHFLLRRISNNDLLALRTLDSEVIAAAIRHIVTGNGTYFLVLFIILILGLAALWTLFAGAGRALTLTMIIGRPVGIFNVALAQAFRTIVTIFCVVFFFGAMFLAAYISISRDGEMRIGLYYFLVLLDLAFTAILWTYGNWVFWLASIAAGVHARFFGPKPSVFFTARSLSRDAQHMDIEIAFGMLRTVLFVIFFTLSIVPTIFLARGGGMLASALLGLLTLAYLAAADVLQIARVAAIVKLAMAGKDAIRTAVSTTP